MFNSKNSVRNVIENIYNTFSEINDQIEIVIVDNYSNDGTYEILKELSETYNISLYRQ